VTRFDRFLSTLFLLIALLALAFVIHEHGCPQLASNQIHRIGVR
jgi:hypothetical protein